MNAAAMVIAMFKDFFFGLSPNHKITIRADIPTA